MKKRRFLASAHGLVTLDRQHDAWQQNGAP
jgi:hypothetical protein